jgi:hypothetical protein
LRGNSDDKRPDPASWGNLVAVREFVSSAVICPALAATLTGAKAP